MNLFYMIIFALINSNVAKKKDCYQDCLEKNRDDCYERCLEDYGDDCYGGCEDEYADQKTIFIKENEKLQLSCPLFGKKKAKWYFEGLKIKPSKRVSIKENRTHSILEISPTLHRDMGLFNCEVSNRHFLTYVDIQTPPAISIDPCFAKTAEREVTFRIIRTPASKMATGVNGAEAKRSSESNTTKCYVNDKFYYEGNNESLRIKIDSSITLKCSLMVTGFRKVDSNTAYLELITPKGDCKADKSNGYAWGPKKKGSVEYAPCNVKDLELGFMRRKCTKAGKWGKVYNRECMTRELKNMNEELKNLNDDLEGLNGIKMNRLTKEFNNIIDNYGWDENDYSYVEFLYKLAETRKIADDEYESYIEDGSNEDLEPFTEEIGNIVMCLEKILKILLAKRNCNQTCSTYLLEAFNVYANTKLYQPNYEIQFGNITFERQMLRKNVEEASFPDWSKYIHRRRSKISLLPSFLKNRNDATNYYTSSSYSEDMALILGTKTRGSYINSGLISLDIAMDKKDFKEMNGEDFIECAIEHLQALNKSERSECVFWNFDNGGYWSSEGCTVISSTEYKTVCKCNHLTNFAILITPNQNLSENNRRVLRIISLVGCIISIIALILTFIYYAFMWRQVKSKRAVLVLNLCFALLIANILLLIEFGLPDSIQAACTALAVLLHFFFLAAFFAMLAISIHLMISVFFVFFVFTKTVTIILVALTWVCPLVIVVICMGVKRLDGYGTDLHCWLSLKEGLLWAFVGPALFIILFNFVVVLAVLIRISKTNNLKKDIVKKNKLKSSARNIFILNPLLGLTWIFGVLSVNEHLIVFQYIFTIVNSIQGLFIFILYALCYKPNVKKAAKSKKIVDAKNKEAIGTSKSDNTTSNAYEGLTETTANTYQGLTDVTSSSSQDSHEYQELDVPKKKNSIK